MLWPAWFLWCCLLARRLHSHLDDSLVIGYDLEIIECKGWSGNVSVLVSLWGGPWDLAYRMRALACSIQQIVSDTQHPTSAPAV